MLTVYSRLTTSSGRGRFSRLEAGAALGCFGLESLPMVNVAAGLSGEGAGEGCCSERAIGRAKEGRAEKQGRR